jgi:hypothetical protein
LWRTTGIWREFLAAFGATRHDRNVAFKAPIRSFAYFQPVIEELLSRPLSDTYLEYLRHKMKLLAGKKLTRTETVSTRTDHVQKTTDLDDR